MDMIYKVGAVIIKDRKVLAGRKKDVFIIPGGKIKKGETHADCLKRELEEEFGVELINQKYFGSYSDYAALSPNVRIKIEVYLVDIKGEPKAKKEIEEAVYVNSKSKIKLGSIIEKFIIPELLSRDLIN